MMTRIWNDESGLLTFEWILLFSLLTIGIVGGVATMRNATNIETAEAAGAITALNQSYTVTASLGGTVRSTGAITYTGTKLSGMGETSYTDDAGKVTISEE
ncbi:MAG: hypothetical protein Q4A17_14810 [Thermoguttaceae bacterium]|nr:hypothetical protein [Thermoguttaceae bacterium]MDO4859202.1 hypothetical protein [Thermoguttaceae bacterium]